MARQEFEDDPETTAYHANKRELLRKGLGQGFLTWDEIREALPEEHLSDVELEVFLFTCKNMGIEIRSNGS
jgi:hypothetical protein